MNFWITGDAVHHPEREKIRLATVLRDDSVSFTALERLPPHEIPRFVAWLLIHYNSLTGVYKNEKPR